MPRPTTTPASQSGITWRGAFSLEQREAMIREAAYFRAAERGFAPGHDLDDWLAAEAFIDSGGEAGALSAAALEIQQSSVRGPGEDEKLKRIIKQHPQRAIPQVEGVEPETAPFKE